MSNNTSFKPSRRQILKGLCTAAVVSILPNGVQAKVTQKKLRIAQVGVTGRGARNLEALLRLPNAEVVAIVDVDSERLEAGALECPATTRTFKDYRVMLKEMGDEVDAVLVSTPDHMHAPIAMAAMEAGKHVYCEKPLAHNVKENRELRLMAEKTGLVTQLGIQVSATIGQRMTVKYLQSGLIGKVSEVHVWSNKGWGFDNATFEQPTIAPPANLDWNLWLGVADDRPYREKVYHSFQWRRLLDFGTGTLGDMGVHIFDTPYRAMELTNPISVRSECRTPNGLSHPSAIRTEYTFPSTNYTTKTLKWIWYDGAKAPPKANDIPGFELEPGTEMPQQGCVWVGEKATLMMPHQSAPRTFPRELIRSVPRPKIEPRDHHGEWVDACLGKGKTSSPFTYGGPLCEALQIGVVANQFPGKTLKWDADGLRITNMPEANKFLSREYRAF